MKRLLVVLLASSISLLAASHAFAGVMESESRFQRGPTLLDYERVPDGDDMCACYEPPPPPPPHPPPAPPPPPPPAPAPAPPPPPPPPPPADDEFDLPGEVPGEGAGDPHPVPDSLQGHGSTCWGRELLRSEGGGPWERRLYLYTVWCGRNGKITYRTSSVRTHHDVFCWNSTDPTWTRTFGGASYSLVEVQAWAAISCASIPTGWPNYNDSLMMRVQYFPNGLYRTVAWT